MTAKHCSTCNALQTGCNSMLCKFVIYRLPVTRLDRQVYNDSKIYLHFRMQIVTHHLAYQVLSTLHGPGGSQGLTGLSSALTASMESSHDKAERMPQQPAAQSAACLARDCAAIAALTNCNICAVCSLLSPSRTPCAGRSPEDQLLHPILHQTPDTVCMMHTLAPSSVGVVYTSLGVFNDWMLTTPFSQILSGAPLMRSAL